MSADAPVPAPRAVGETGLLLEVASTTEARELAGALRRREMAGVEDVVAGLRSVLVVVEPDVVDTDALARAHRLPDGSPASGAAAPPGPDGRPPQTVVLPVVFDGADLGAVAHTAGTGPAAVVDALARSALTVEVLGFSPGFAYLSGLPAALARVPRRPRPRPVVPAGSVALANGFAAVYPQATPGGWQLVGRTATRLFDPSTPPYAVLQPGDTVRLRPAAATDGPAAPDPGVRAATPGGAPGLAVMAPGLLSLVHDAGRAGLAHLGVPRAGPADPVAHALANRLVGNPEGSAALEVTAAGPVLRARRDLHVALVGGGPAPLLDGLPVPVAGVVPLRAGQVLAIGPTTAGLRSTLAVEGGLSAPRLLGSASTDTLSWTGPGALAAGDELVAGAGPARPLGGHLVDDPTRPPAGPWTLRVLPGPHAGWFAPDALAALADRTFVVGADSDRVGLRLQVADGGPPLGRRAGELVTEGMVAGAVQVPPDGQPIVLGPDHATLGGYPVLAVVTVADLAVTGRCRPGDMVRLVPVGRPEADAARRALRRRLQGAVTGLYPRAPGS